MLRQLLIEKPPTRTPEAWRVTRALVNRTRNQFWEWVVTFDGTQTTTSIHGPQSWPASGEPPRWIHPRDVVVISPYHSLGRHI
jgi:hypothetical protein